jgi:hypothetical protein
MTTAATARQFRYTFCEFLDHLKAMHMVRQWEYTTRFGDVGTSQTKEAHDARLLEYFADCYKDKSEAFYKARLYRSICDYIGRNAGLFSKHDFVARENSGSFSVEPALLRAVHYAFSSGVGHPHMEPKQMAIAAAALKTSQKFN